MDLRAALLFEHSMEQTQSICDHIGDDPQRFAELMKLFVGSVYRVSQRAAWAVSNCIEQHPELVKPHYGTLFKQLEREDAHVAVKRNVVRLLQFVEIPKRYEGRVFDACYNMFADVSEPIAVRCFSMTVAVNIAKDSPELMAELKAVAANQPEKMSAGFRSRVKRHFGL